MTIDFSRRDALKLSAGLAHEFKNALATLHGYAQLLQNSKLDDATQELDRLRLELRVRDDARQSQRTVASSRVE